MGNSEWELLPKMTCRPAMQQHLLDADSNAGERVRQAIRALRREMA